MVEIAEVYGRRWAHLRIVDDEMRDVAHDGQTPGEVAVPSRVRCVEIIDKTSVGKLDKKLLRQKYSD
jgi:acyl-CoA synthetase (AMP-forming)/AMP-acid ligase II